MSALVVTLTWECCCTATSVAGCTGTAT